MYSHLANARHGIRRLPSNLHVIAVVFNPLRFLSRYNLYKEFADRAEAQGATLWVVELAFGARPFEIAVEGRPRNILFRSYQELWHKERMINEAVSRLPSDWEYVAWVDADISFINDDWVHETMQQLQHYSIVQMFTHAMDVGPNGEPREQHQGFAFSHLLGNIALPRLNGVQSVGDGYYYARYWHPGYGWAYRRNAWNVLGGMLDVNIVGGGDHQMSYGLIGKIEGTIPANSTYHYEHAIRAWQTNALMLKKNIGAVPGTVIHHFHGHKAKRGYVDRWKILTENKFDPVTDIRSDWQRMWELTGDKIRLRDELRAYFRLRQEDSIDL